MLLRAMAEAKRLRPLGVRLNLQAGRAGQGKARQGRAEQAGRWVRVLVT